MNERILIVDDEETLCYFLKESLEEKGYQALAAHTARDGLDLLMRQQIDLVLLDLKLPDGDGLNVLYEIRKVDSDLPVIVLTGHAAVESAVQAMKLGAYDYLKKPINLAELSFTVAEALESSRAVSPASAGIPAARPDITSAGAPSLDSAERAQVVTAVGRSLRDQAEMSRVYRRLERQIQELLALDHISSGMMESLQLDEVVEGTVDRLLQLSSVEMAAVFLGDGGGGELVLASQRRFPPNLWEDPGLRRLSAEVILRTFAAHRDGALPLTEAASDPWTEQMNARLGNDTVALLVPLRGHDKLWGVMVIGRRGRQGFDDNQVRTFCLIAQRLALVVGHATQFSSLRERVGRLSESAALRDGILQDMMHGLVVIDREGKVTLVNRAGEEMLGCKEDEVLGSSVESVLGPGAEIVRDSLEGSLVYPGEEVAVRREGEGSIPLGMSVSPLRDDVGKLNGVVVMLSDLREAKALEEERRRLDRVAVLGEMSALMAHEIRNPLAGMVAGLQHMLSKFEEGDQRREAMQRILRESERVNRIIEDILLISRPPHLNLEPCDISEVMEEVISSWAEKAGGQGVEVSKYYATELPLVRGDRMRLHQALSNLVMNGIEAMPDGGELNIAVTGPAQVGAGLRAEEGYVEVEIRDSGLGIKEEEIGKIFEPFYTTKARGTGLGLAITRRIINEHGGEVEVKSEEGKGTRFVVRLPLARRGGS